MSSRALRRAQKELEEKQLQERLAQEEQEEDESGEEVAPQPAAKPSLFAMLGDADGNEDDEGEEDEEEQDADVEPASKLQPEAAPVTKSKKSKKKKKGKNKTSSTVTPKESTVSANDSGLDEIDQALLALNLTANGKGSTDTEETSTAESEEKKQLFVTLSVDSQHLHAANEMKKLFGRAALQHTDEEVRPRQRGQQGGIAAAVAGRNAPSGRGLSSLGLRRSIFVQGKEEWPRATSGGLGMEVVEKRADGSVEYRFVHNRTYQEVQRQFQICVESMDSERMIQLLHSNPYHISTLLQVSEIAKQQRDNATASDLLERALFTFGRSVHSTFSTNLAAGKARLNFWRPENREFWLAIWRYVATLGVRATWRTAFEWAKLLLAMDPEQDPYCIRLVIDQFALRGRDAQAIVDLVETEYLERQWKVPPNLAFSIALAHDRLKQPQKARSTLRNAVKEYPWLASRLCKELDISPIPKPVWGKEPNGVFQEILCQLYVPKVKDLWNTTEGTSLLVEVCYSFEEELGDGLEPYWLAPIPELDLARHVILTDDRNLISMLDTKVKAKFTSVSDPLPPDNSITSYDISSSSISGQPRSPAARQQLLANLEELRQYFQSIDTENLVGTDLTEESLIRVLEQAGTSLEEFRRNSDRFQIVRTRLQDEGVQVVFNNEVAQQPGSDSEESE